MYSISVLELIILLILSIFLYLIGHKLGSTGRSRSNSRKVRNSFSFGREHSDAAFHGQQQARTEILVLIEQCAAASLAVTVLLCTVMVILRYLFNTVIMTLDSLLYNAGIVVVTICLAAAIGRADWPAGWSSEYPGFASRVVGELTALIVTVYIFIGLFESTKLAASMRSTATATDLPLAPIYGLATVVLGIGLLVGLVFLIFDVRER